MALLQAVGLPRVSASFPAAQWKQRVFLDPEDLSLACGKHDLLKSTVFRSMDTLHSLLARYLNAVFVRRQRFDNTKTNSLQRTHKQYELTRRQLPDLFSTWYRRSYEDECAAEAIIRLENNEGWPHNRYHNYAVDADRAFDSPLFKRHFRQIEPQLGVSDNVSS